MFSNPTTQSGQPANNNVDWSQYGAAILAKLAPRNGADPNVDILVTPQLGPWMISVIGYSGPDAPLMARQMVSELRQPHYKQPAYVHNFGAEERKKEYERVKDLIEKQREYLQKTNQPFDQPLRIRYMRVEEQCGVLIGGYANEQQARRALDALRQLPAPDPSRVQLHSSVSGAVDQADPTERSFINPFQQAFLVRNPTIQVNRPSDWDQLDVKTLRKLNADEPYSLFKCTRPVTLAITQFQTPTVVQSKSGMGALLEGMGIGKKSGQQADGAALSAHNLAEMLSKDCGLKAYVLHTPYSSVVCVGEFDNPQDRELLTMQDLLKRRLQLGTVPLFATPMPMQVPR